MEKWLPEEQVEPSKAWVEGRPLPVQAVILKLPPWVGCFRYVDRPDSHYRIHSYDEHKDGRTVSLTIIHGRDSHLPGVAAFGIPPEHLEPCGCGNWEPPTKDQIDVTREEIEAIKEKGDMNE